MSKNLIQSLILGLLILITAHLSAQSVGINTNSPHPSAALEVLSGDKGVLIPRMTSGERSGIMSPANGLLVYDTTTKSFWYYKASLWTEISKGVFENNAGVVRNTGNHGTDDFLFGSPALPTAGVLSDTLMFFDISKGAFRAGVLSNSNAWAPDSIGKASIAIGRNAKASGNYSTAMGYNPEANGAYSTAMGTFTEANGLASTAMGNNTRADGLASTATGANTRANGTYSFSAGSSTISRAAYSMALGRYNVGAGDSLNWVDNDALFEIGIGTNILNRKNALTVIKNGDLIVGRATVPPATPITDSLMYFDKSKGAFRAGVLSNSNAWAPDSIGKASIALGRNAKASGDYSTAMGSLTEANGSTSTAMGYFTEANGSYSTAMGYDTEANGIYSTAMGWYAAANGSHSTAIGENTKAHSMSSTALGRYNVGFGTDNAIILTDPVLEVGIGTSNENRKNALTVIKNGDLIIGRENVPPPTAITETIMFFDKSKGALRSGYLNNSSNWAETQIGNYSFASGENTKAIGVSSTAIGKGTSANAPTSFTIGEFTVGNGQASFAGGIGSIAEATASFAFGNQASAIGQYSTAFGNQTVAMLASSTAFGDHTLADGVNSTAIGEYTKAHSMSSTALGRYNVGFGTNNAIIPTDPVLEVGVGIADNNRKNALTILKNGDFIVGGHILPPAAVTTDTLIFFDRSKGAFRAGVTRNSDNWGPDSIGVNSFAAGYNSLASGFKSISIGDETRAKGPGTTALGTATTANGDNSTALGFLTTAHGDYATAIGGATIAQGDLSTSMGFYTIAGASHSLVFGRYNVGAGSASSWISTDPILEIGIGQSEATRKNAVTILKNGNTGIGIATPDSPLQIFSNASSTIPQLKLTESAADDGARIIFDNSIETTNRWTLYGRADNTDANSTFNVFYNGIGNIITADGLGNVGIKCNPDADFHVRHSNSGGSGGFKLQNGTNDEFARLYVSSTDGNLRIYFDTSGLKGTFNDVTGVYSTVSDRRLKGNFEDLPFDWNSFSQLTPLSYTYKHDHASKRYIGMIAQDVNEIYPELINYAEDEDIYTMDYSGFGVIAIKAIQELKAENDAKEARIDRLSETVASQQKEIQTLQEQSIEILELRKAVSELKTLMAEKL